MKRTKTLILLITAVFLYSPSWTYKYGPVRYESSQEHHYGSTFGRAGLPENTYIASNLYYGEPKAYGGFLSNALFKSEDVNTGINWGGKGLHRIYGSSRILAQLEDFSWRDTTKAPYFENKIPGEELIIPAASVVGAATAFGLVTLLPLNVPPGKPLMYCNKNSSEIAQALISFGQNIYQCNEGKFLKTHISCFDAISTNETSSNSITGAPETNSKSECSANKNSEGTDQIYSRNETLFGTSNIFCNSTRLLKTSNLKEPFNVLNCYEGSLYKSQASFIPTTTSTTAAPTTTTEKSLSFAAHTHLFLLKLIGSADILKIPEKTATPEPAETSMPNETVDESLPLWVPEAMRIAPPTTTTLRPFVTKKYEVGLEYWKFLRGEGIYSIYNFTEKPKPLYKIGNPLYDNKKKFY